MRRVLLGQANLARAFRIPSQASLPGILKTHPAIASQMALRFRFAQESFEKYGFAIGSQAEMSYTKFIRKRNFNSILHNMLCVRSENRTSHDSLPFIPVPLLF